MPTRLYPDNSPTFLLILFSISFRVFFINEVSGQPQAQRIDHVVNINDNLFNDPYFWMSDKNQENVISYLNQENDYGSNFLEQDSLLVKKIYAEILNPWYTPPVLHDIKMEENGNIKNETNVFEWKKVEGEKLNALVTSKNDTLFDLNKLAGKSSYFDMRYYTSSNNKYLALLIDTIGREEYFVHLFDLVEIKNNLPEISHLVTNLVWAEDNKSLFYVVPDSITKRWAKIYDHDVLNPDRKDSVFYCEQDVETNVFLSSAKNGSVLINAEGPGRFEQYIVAGHKIISICERTSGIENHIKFYNRDAFVLTNFFHSNFSIVRLTNDQEKISESETIFSGSDSIVIKDFFLKKNYVIIEIAEGPAKSLLIYNTKSRKIFKIQGDCPVADYVVSEDAFQFSDTLLYTYLPANRPYEYHYFNLKTQKQKIERPSYLFPDSLNESTLKSELIFATSVDNVKIPISLVYLNGAKLDGTAVLELEAYGAYGDNKQAGFSFLNWPFLKRGGIIAYAHVRGGGEYGAKWHQESMYSKKATAVNDLLTCANYLIQHQYSSNGKICLNGGSAGAVILSGAVNINPEYFGCMIIRVPFLDVITTMSDSLLPGVIAERDEWGNPWNTDNFNGMNLYDPYRNIKMNNFPSILVRSSYNDSRVMYWEAAKYVASVRFNQKTKSEILLLMDFEGGHKNKNFKIQAAENYSFIYRVLR